MLTRSLNAALARILDRWAYRPGLIRLGGVALNVNFAARVKRIVRPHPVTGRQAPPGFTYSRSGLLVPLREFSLSHNIVTNGGLDSLLDVYLSAGTQITSWFVGLTTGTPSFAAGDTMASHAGWTEWTTYNEATRVAWSDGSVSSQSVDNSASPATFTSSSDSQTAGGAFLTSNSTKGGATGTLYAGSAFASNKALDTSETIDVTATFTSADDGV